MPNKQVQDKQEQYVEKAMAEGMALMEEITEFSADLKDKRIIGNATTARVTLIGKKVDLINEGVRAAFRRS